MKTLDKIMERIRQSKDGTCTVTGGEMKKVIKEYQEDMVKVRIFTLELIERKIGELK